MQFDLYLKAHMNVRRLMSDNRNVRRRNKGPHGNKVANGQTGPVNGAAMVKNKPITFEIITSLKKSFLGFESHLQEAKACLHN